MSIEDDTFNALRRLPFEEMRQTIRRAKKEKQPYSELKRLLEKNGWTRHEYQKKLALEIYRI